MSVPTFKFDASEAIETPEDELDYLTDAFDTGDAAVMAYALGVVARARGMTDVARQAGVQREHLYRALSATGRPEMTTVLKVVQALGFQMKIIPAETVAA